MAVVTGKTAEEFETAFNEKMIELSSRGIGSPDVSFNMAQGHCAYITWTEEIQQLDCVADEFHMEGLRYLCKNCPLHDPISDGRKKTTTCKFSELGIVHMEHEACELFYKKVKQGSIAPLDDGELYRISERKKHYAELVEQYKKNRRGEA